MIGTKPQAIALLFTSLLGACSLGPPSVNSLTSFSKKGVVTHASINENVMVVSNDFYPKSFLNDKRWEKYRLGLARGRRAADWHLLRRDVRWYPSPFGSRDACAAVYYTLAAPNVSPDQLKYLEIARLEILSKETGMDYPVRCTSDGRVWYAKVPDDGLSPQQRSLTYLIDPRAKCSVPESSDQISIKPLEPVWLSVHVHPKIAKAPDAAFTYGEQLPGIPAAAIHRAYSSKGLPTPVLLRSSPDRSRAPVKMTVVVALNPEQTPYCVRLTVRRGSRVWSHSIYRLSPLPKHNARMTDIYGRSTDPKYWTPLTDITNLSERFAAALVFEPGARTKLPD